MTDTPSEQQSSAEKTDAAAPSPPPPRGPSLRRVVTWLVVSAVMVWIGVTWGPGIKATTARMVALVRPAGAEADHGDGTTYYTCGMHPWVILPRPGLCPICHMELTPLDPDKFTGEITIDPVVTQNIGVRIEPVVKGPLVQTIRTVGTVDYDETLVRDVNIKVSGWIEKLDVDFLGAEVQKGQPLFELYSPDLYEAQEEYLLEYKRQQTLAATGVADQAGGLDLLESARVRLEYYDITPEQIRKLEAAGAPSKTMTIHSPHTGVVIAKNVNEGMRVDPGTLVFRIADLSRVWVMVTLYEQQLPFVQAGQTAIMSLPYIPGQTFEGKVIYIYPYLDKTTRQVNVRLEFENPTGLLKPGMYANIELRSTLAEERTLVPRAAIVDTGERQVAYVSLGEGRFEPRELLVGTETAKGMVEVLSGLKPGEMVVTSGEFLLDSEAKMREALAKMLTGTMAAGQEAVVAVAGASELSSLPPAMESALNDMLTAYFAIGGTLAGDSVESVPTRARDVAAEVDRLLKIEVPGHPHFWHEHEEAATIRGAALELIDAPDIERARVNFADLSVALGSLVRATGVPKTYGVEVNQLHCPMYREGQGGSIWLQPKGSPRNPFYGAVMLECFDERTTLPVTGGAETPAQPASTPPPAAPDGAGSGPVAQAPAGPDQRDVDALVEAYFGVHELLTGDRMEGVADRLAAVRDAAMALAAGGSGPVAGKAEVIAAAGGRPADDLQSAREAFEAMTGPLADLLELSPPSETVAPVTYRMYCPMVKKYWLQPSETVANPYAPEMLRCGRVAGTFAARSGKVDSP